MKRSIPVLSGVLLLAACGEKEQPAETAAARPERPQRTASLTPTTGDPEQVGSERSLKTAERPPVEKKPPVAEPVPDKPGMVISPHSGKPVDVRGIPAGRLVMDPYFPAAENKRFRVPEGVGGEEPQSSEEKGDLVWTDPDAESQAITAKPVPGKTGHIFSPYDNSVFDVSGSTPGSIFQDSENRYIRIPEDFEPEE